MPALVKHKRELPYITRNFGLAAGWHQRSYHPTCHQTTCLCSKIVSFPLWKKRLANGIQTSHWEYPKVQLPNPTITGHKYGYFFSGFSNASLGCPGFTFHKSAIAMWDTTAQPLHEPMRGGPLECSSSA